MVEKKLTIIVLLVFAGAMMFLFFIGISLIINGQSDLKKQIEQRDSVNIHNQKVIDSLNEYIRLDSLTQLEQLYPTE